MSEHFRHEFKKTFQMCTKITTSQNSRFSSSGNAYSRTTATRFNCSSHVGARDSSVQSEQVWWQLWSIYITIFSDVVYRNVVLEVVCCLLMNDRKNIHVDQDFVYTNKVSVLEHFLGTSLFNISLNFLSPEKYICIVVSERVHLKEIPWDMWTNSKWPQK